ncbi:B-cell differentiation antigen CD72 isoform X2 [Sminthopsis crassicaudata]|uniref:B-cell differentiation antigen CD72 isoform X2 n=1 Tax=Sminthopsis crassicaudata TaxID=9301 RepID=UPI003D69A2C7
MAESITYADLRFVKSPLKKSLSARQKQGPMTWTPYILLSLLGTCLLLGITTISLGIQYMQLSHQLSDINQVLEVTNGSLRQQLQMGAAHLSSKEKDLQVTREDLAQTQKKLKVEQDQLGATENFLLTCRLEWNKTKLSLENNIEQKRNLEKKLKILQNGLKQVQSLFDCSLQSSSMRYGRREDQESRHFHQFQEYCCPLGWTLFKNKCLYISSCKTTWKESDSFCQSLSSKLLGQSSVEDMKDRSSELQAIKETFKQKIIFPYDNERNYDFWCQGCQMNPKPLKDQNTCSVIKIFQGNYFWISTEKCNKSLFFICEKEAIERPHPVEMEDHFFP